MKSNNWIYSFFISLALLFWNPISYFLIYGRIQIFSQSQNYIFYWIYSLIFIIGIVFIYLIQKNKLNENSKKLIFSITFLGIIFSIFVVANIIVGLSSSNDSENVQSPRNLIFEPNSRAKYHTSEFSFDAIINNIGLRDEEINIDKGDKCRILCFGDSWTYGWGVNINESWPKMLEKYLNDSGYSNIEVINCGRPAMYTTKYKLFMEKYVPLLKPDLVLVGVLQLDDLVQLYPNKLRENQIQIFNKTGIIKNIWLKVRSIFLRFLKYSFNNILPSSKSVDITSKWEIWSASIMDDFSYWQKIRFHTLDETEQNMFISGNLDPALLDWYMNFPDRVTIFNNPDHPATKYSIREMGRDIKAMNNLCNEYNSDLIFVNIPMDYFTGHVIVRDPSNVLNSYYITHNNIDSIYRSIAEANNLHYIEMTNHFIELKNKTDYFFKYDGHPNENGYDEIAKFICNKLIENNASLLRINK